MRIALRLLIAALLAPAAVAAAETDGTAAMPTAVAGYLERATAQGSWPQVAAAYFAQSTGTTATYPAEAAELADRRVPLGDAGAALTGLLLADMASNGRVRLDDPISRYLPAGFVCADARVCALTLQQLAAQDTSLPRLPANLFPADAADPWRDYGETDLLDFLANYHLPETSAARESPLGNVLLAWLLGRTHGAGYAAALAERVTAPLQLGASGVGRGDDATTQTPLPVYQYSSARDLSRLLRAMLRPGDSPLRAALLLSRQPRDAQQRWGLGWRLRPATVDGQEWPLVWQSGGGNGQNVFFGFRTDQQQALALVGTAEISLQPLGLAALDDAALPPLPAATPTTAPTFIADDYTGLYEFSRGNSLLIRGSERGLVAQTSGRLGMKLVPLSPDLFAVEHSAIRLSFQRDARGQVETLRWSENGVIVPVPRLSRRAPTIARGEVALAPAKLADYCGDYAVDGDVLARLSCGSGLALQFSGSTRRELFAYAEDRFASRDGDLELVARRDAEGRVRALSLILLGSETELLRVRWTPLPAAIAGTLQRDRELQAQERAAAAARNAAAAQTQSAAAAATVPVAAAAQTPNAAAAAPAATVTQAPTTTAPSTVPSSTATATPWATDLPAAPAPATTPYRAPGGGSPAAMQTSPSGTPTSTSASQASSSPTSAAPAAAAQAATTAVSPASVESAATSRSSAAPAAPVQPSAAPAATIPSTAAPSVSEPAAPPPKAVAPATSAAATAPPSPSAKAAAIVNTDDVKPGRPTAEPKVQAAPAKPPAHVEPLPEKFERPRFAPPRNDDKVRDNSSKEATDDGA
ncbi:MAG TPA: serine hydrolase [Tahibacter sp.]|nr:serine hydrolase [Tahibacter sp.]